MQILAGLLHEGTGGGLEALQLMPSDLGEMVWPTVVGCTILYAEEIP